MEQKKLWDNLQKGILERLYLLYGEEEYLVGFYAMQIEEMAKKAQEEPFYKDTFDGGTPASEIILAANTVPFLPGRRFILVRDSKLFAAGRKNDSELLADFLPNIPPDTIIVFMESDVDRRLRLFKKATEVGCVVNNEKQTADALHKWLARQAKSKGLALPASVAALVVSICGTSMTRLFFEMEKLTAYALNKGTITPSDVHEICAPTLEARIFALTKAMGLRDAPGTLSHYRTMVLLKESPLMVLTMVVRQLRLILLYKLASEKNIPRQKLAAELKVRDFVLNELSVQGKNFTKEKLLQLLRDCLETDVKIKTGLVGDVIGVEMLLVKIAS